MRVLAALLILVLVVIAIHGGSYVAYSAFYGWSNSYDLHIPREGWVHLAVTGLRRSISGLIFCYNVVSENINGTPVLFTPILDDGERVLYVIFPEHSYTVYFDKYTSSPISMVAYTVNKDKLYLFTMNIRTDFVINQSVIIYGLVKLRVGYNGVSVIERRTLATIIHRGILPAIGLGNIFGGVVIDNDIIVARLPTTIIIYSDSLRKAVILKAVGASDIVAVYKYLDNILLWNGTHVFMINKSLGYVSAYVNGALRSDVTNYVSPMFYVENHTFYLIAGYDVVYNTSSSPTPAPSPGSGGPIYSVNVTIDRYIVVFNLGEDPIRGASTANQIKIKITERPQRIMLTDSCGWYAIHNSTIYVLNPVFNQSITDMDFYNTGAVLQAISLNGTVLWKTRLHNISRYIYLLNINNKTELAIPALHGILLIDPRDGTRGFLPLDIDGSIAMIMPVHSATGYTKLYIYVATRIDIASYNYMVYILGLSINAIEIASAPEPWIISVLLIQAIIFIALRRRMIIRLTRPYRTIDDIPSIHC